MWSATVLRDPGVAGDRRRVFDLLEGIARYPGLREDAESCSGIDEPPGRDLDREVCLRPADADRARIGRECPGPFGHRSCHHLRRGSAHHSRWKTSSSRRWNPVAGSVSGSMRAAICSCQRAFASLVAIASVNAVEVVDLEVSEQVVAAQEDRIVPGAGRPEVGQQVGPDGRVPPPVFRLTAGQEAHRETDPFHLSRCVVGHGSVPCFEMRRARVGDRGPSRLQPARIRTGPNPARRCCPC